MIPSHKTIVTIVLPVYNAEVFIGESIRSVVEQSFQDWELIIVDDASVDTSVERVKIYSVEDERIRLIQLNKNSGAAVARNIAIEHARGRYIAFLDSDDIWLTHKLMRQFAFMQQTGAVFTCSAYEKIDVNGNPLGQVGVPAKVEYSDLLKTCSIGCLTAMYDTEYFGKIYMPNIRKRQDFGLWLELLKKTKYVYGINETLAKYRVRSDSISANKLNAAQYTWRLYRDLENLNLVKSIFYFSHYAVRGLLRVKAPSLARKLGLLE